MKLAPRTQAVMRAAREGVYGAAVLARTGMVAANRPSRTARAVTALARWDVTMGGGCAVAAALYPSRDAIVDERGRITYGELHRRTNALAHALRRNGVGEGDGVAILCRNHRGFVEATIAASKLGADSLYLGTGLAAPQLREIVARERPAALIHDEEFSEVADGLVDRKRCVVAWHDGDAGTTIDGLVAHGDTRDLRPPRRHGRVVLLTSGTTGAPKGAARGESYRFGPLVQLLSAIPLRARGVTHIASPLYHSWGYTHMGLGIALTSTLVLRRRFDPAEALALVARERATALVVVPTMLQRFLALPREVRRQYDTSSLAVVACSGSPLQGSLAKRIMDDFGDVLYNLYGSTEVAWVTIAGPADLRSAQGTAGRPPHGTRVAIFDDDGVPVPRGRTGRIFAGNGYAFDGYTDGRGKTVIRGLMSTGDLGHLDGQGRLFVDGREDDMIVSGGENVFPSEIENLLADHPDIAEVAVVGVEDEEFGQRLKAFVVLRDGATTTVASLANEVRTSLAPFKVPREIEVVSELPRNETGKVVKLRLPVS